MKVEIRNNKIVIDGYVNAVERESKVLYDRKIDDVIGLLPYGGRCNDSSEPEGHWCCYQCIRR